MLTLADSYNVLLAFNESLRPGMVRPVLTGVGNVLTGVGNVLAGVDNVRLTFLR
jgi:hypothetical protein